MIVGGTQFTHSQKQQLSMKSKKKWHGGNSSPQALLNAINRSTTRGSLWSLFCCVVRRSFIDLRISSMEAVIARDRRLWPIGLNELVARFDWNELTPRSFSILSLLDQWMLRVSYLDSLSFHTISGSQLRTVSYFRLHIHWFMYIRWNICNLVVALESLFYLRCNFAPVSKSKRIFQHFREFSSI